MIQTIDGSSSPLADPADSARQHGPSSNAPPPTHRADPRQEPVRRLDLGPATPQEVASVMAMCGDTLGFSPDDAHRRTTGASAVYGDH